MTHPKRWFLLLAALGLTWAGWRALVPQPVANSPPPRGPIIALGDSLTAGVGAGKGQSYPEQLSKLIGRPVLDRGVPGDTAAGALARIDADILAAKPGIVIVCLGGNDLLRNHDADATFKTLETIIERIQARGAMVVLVGVEGLALLTPDFGKRFKQLARRRQCLYVPDILDGIFGRASLMSDQIHPNKDGYAIMADRIAKAMRPYLN